jgi:myo-inositol-1(or 4)-monophosphatase
MTPTLIEIEAMARYAGEILSAGYGQNIQVNQKGTIDLVTEIDNRSESYLLHEIQKHFPEHRILAEESGEQYGEDCCLWYIDPLDGTVNYAHGVPVFTVSIAYQESGMVILGVVYDPMRDELFSAERGNNALLNGKKIAVKDTTDLDHSLLATGFPYDIRTHTKTNLDNFSRFALRCQGIRRLGSAALDLCYVACGRFDGFWELRLSAWDIAAGGLIAEAAGALVTGIHGEPNYLAPPQSILAANPELHRAMLDVLSKSEE